MKKFSRVLAVGAHPDDIDVGAGGFVARCIEEGKSVHYLILSKCLTNAGIKQDSILKEMEEAASTLGVKEVEVLDFENTMLSKEGSGIRKALENIRDSFKPEVIICPNIHDSHQDHVAAGIECTRVFRVDETILCYEILRNGTPLIKANLFVDISSQIEKKVAALNAFTSQKSRPYFAKGSYRSLARIRGIQSHCKYAEAFLALRCFW